MRCILEIWTTEINTHIIVHIFHPVTKSVTSPQLLRARPTGTHPCRANTLCLANQPYCRRLLCSSGLGLRIIAAPRGLSPQYTKRLTRNGSVAVSERFDKTKNLLCAGWCLLNPRRQTLRACLNTLQAFGAVAEPHSET